jgi:hypothetical protein
MVITDFTVCSVLTRRGMVPNVYLRGMRKMDQEHKTEKQMENEEDHKFIRRFIEENRNDNSLGEYAKFIAGYYTAIRKFQSEINRFSSPGQIKVLIDRKDKPLNEIEGWIEAQLSMYSDARKELSGTIKRLKHTQLSLARTLMMKEAEDSENIHSSM